MAWIRLRNNVLINSDKLTIIEICHDASDKNRCWIKFSIDCETSFRSTTFESFNDCISLFNKLCDKIETNSYIDIDTR